MNSPGAKQKGKTDTWIYSAQAVHGAEKGKQMLTQDNKETNQNPEISPHLLESEPSQSQASNLSPNLLLESEQSLVLYLTPVKRKGMTW
jgi:hypothetical protein